MTYFSSPVIPSKHLWMVSRNACWSKLTLDSGLSCRVLKVLRRPLDRTEPSGRLLWFYWCTEVALFDLLRSAHKPLSSVVESVAFSPGVLAVCGANWVL